MPRFRLFPGVALLYAAAACGGYAPSPSALPATTGSGGTNAPRHLDAPAVVLISFDGLRSDYLDRFGVPNFRRVAEAGVRAEGMIPVFPTKTFPTHYSVATGLYAENHGLVGNRFWDPERGERYTTRNREVVEDGTWYGGEPIWVTAETQGMVAASYFFVGSEADVGGVRPTYWNRYDGSVPNTARVDQVLEWLAMPPETRPRMITLYFSDLDDVGHRYGPDGPEVQEALTAVDGALGRLLDGIEAMPHGDEVYVILVSDHGMFRADPDKVYVIDPGDFPGVRVAEMGPYASFFVENGGAERARRVRDSLQTTMPEARVWLREDVPERFHYSADPRIGDIVALADPGWQIVTPDRVPEEVSYTHGWDNAFPAMHAIFLAMGPRIAPGLRIERFESVHVYPLIAEILGLTPNPEADGRLEVLGGILSR